MGRLGDMHVAAFFCRRMATDDGVMFLMEAGSLGVFGLVEPRIAVHVATLITSSAGDPGEQWLSFDVVGPEGKAIRSGIPSKQLIGQNSESQRIYPARLLTPVWLHTPSCNW
jgi:hypothetical protein